MKTLMLVPLFALIQPVCSARPCDSTDWPATSNATSNATNSSSRTESEPVSKKKSAPPTTTRPTTPKQPQSARPAHLFME